MDALEFAATFETKFTLIFLLHYSRAEVQAPYRSLCAWTSRWLDFSNVYSCFTVANRVLREENRINTQQQTIYAPRLTFRFAFLPVHFDFGHHGALESECSRKAAASSSSRRESFALHLAPDEQHLLRNRRLRDTKQNMLAAALLTNLNPISYRN
jgi:hypothetical protein